MADGFYIEGLEEFSKTLERHKSQIPSMLSRILESLGEVLLDEAQDVLKNTKTPHSRFEMRSKPIIRGKNKGKQRNYIAYVGKENASSVDTGNLWRSFSKGGSGNIWIADYKSANFRLVVGSNIKHARFINDGFNRKRRWVPGVVQGNGIFRYQPGAKTGIMVNSGHFTGIHFFEIAFSEIEKLMPTVVENELRRFFYEFEK